MRLMEAKSIVADVFNQLEVPELVPAVDIVYSDRLKTTAGTAIWRNYLGEGTIKLSSAIFSIATYEQRYETVVHEACHIVEGKVWNSAGHGRWWKHYMEICGFPNAQRCHNIVERKRQEKVQCYCGCPGGIMITKNRRSRIMNATAQYICRRCGKGIMLKPRIVVEFVGRL